MSSLARCVIVITHTHYSSESNSQSAFIRSDIFLEDYHPNQNLPERIVIRTFINSNIYLKIYSVNTPFSRQTRCSLLRPLSARVQLLKRCERDLMKLQQIQQVAVINGVDYRVSYLLGDSLMDIVILMSGACRNTIASVIESALKITKKLL